MKSISNFKWLWALLLTASFFISCATVPILVPKPKTIPALECEHIAQLTDDWLLDRSEEARRQAGILKANYVILEWTCKAKNIALINTAMDLVYWQDIPGKDSVLICAKFKLGLKSTLIEDELIVDHTGMEIVSIKTCKED